MPESQAFDLPLPIRLRPRWQRLATNLPLWLAGAFVAWKLAEQGRIDLKLHLYALIVLAIAILSLLPALLSLLPRAPFVNLTVDFDGLQHRRFLLLQKYTWAQLSELSVGPRRWWPRYRPPMVLGYQTRQAERGEKPNIAVEIDPRRYGQGDADDLCSWLYEVHHLALTGQLQPHMPIAVPPAFRRTAFSLAPHDQAPPPADTSSANRNYRPPPTVERG